MFWEIAHRTVPYHTTPCYAMPCNVMQYNLIVILYYVPTEWLLEV